MLLPGRGSRFTYSLGLVCLTLGIAFATAATPHRLTLTAAELLQHPGFEDAGALSVWVATTGTLRRDATQPRSGSQAAAFTHSAVTVSAFEQMVAIDPAYRYTFSGYCQTGDPNLTVVALRIRWFTSTDGTGSQSGATLVQAFTLGNSYHTVTLSSVQPGASIRSARVGVETASTGTSATVYCDDFTLTNNAPDPTTTPTTVPTDTPTLSPTVTASATPSHTPTPDASATSTPTQAPTSTPTASATPLPSDLVNPGFELSDLSAWSTTQGTLTRDADARSGAFAGSFNVAAADTGRFFQVVSADDGESYRFGGYCRNAGTAQSTVSLSITFLASNDGTGVGLLQALVVVQPAATYEVVQTALSTAPGATQSLRAEVQVTGDSTAATALCDDLFLEHQPFVPTSTPTPSPTQRPSRGGSAERPSPTATRTPTSTAVPADSIRISEVLYDPASIGQETRNEWVELENTTGQAISLDGWTVSDNRESDPLPDVVIDPHNFLVLATSPGTLSRLAASQVIIADGTLGNGLANDGDRLILRDSAGRTVDGLSWGDDTSVSNPACGRVPPGHSLQRVSGDSSGCGFFGNPEPSPGLENIVLTPTPTRTGTPTRTVTPTRTATVTRTLIPSRTPSATRTVLAVATVTPAASATPSAEEIQVESAAQPAPSQSSGDSQMPTQDTLVLPAAPLAIVASSPPSTANPTNSLDNPTPPAYAPISEPESDLVLARSGDNAGLPDQAQAVAALLVVTIIGLVVGMRLYRR